MAAAIPDRKYPRTRSFFCTAIQALSTDIFKLLPGLFIKECIPAKAPLSCNQRRVFYGSIGNNSIHVIGK